ncbi:MAG: PleD family two-component system response regulator [Cyanobacteria bacterium CRU_2_1]|nr:PleD family two-component system response regulator [Cyanobacteria bacterium CRU_2_1]
MLLDDPNEAPLILIVDDEKLMRMQLRQSLEQQGYRVAEATDGDECLLLYAELNPDMVLLDALMPMMDGFTCCHKLQALAGENAAPVLMITGLEDNASVDQAFAVGATDFITKPIHWAVLLHRVKRIIRQVYLQREQARLYQQLEAFNQKLQHLATIDGLTQVANRRQFDERFDCEWRRMAREQTPLSLILCDVDFFKLYNDTYGHQAGDECLRQVARAISAVVKRPADLVTRYGGEEFAVILPNTESSGAIYLAETIRLRVYALRLPHATSWVSDRVSLSLGVATITPQPDSDSTLLILAADKALYQAKEQGRDRVGLAKV